MIYLLSQPRNVVVHYLRAAWLDILSLSGHILLTVLSKEIVETLYVAGHSTKSGLFLQPVILFLNCGGTQEASYVKSKFKIFKTGLPGKLESVSTEQACRVGMHSTLLWGFWVSNFLLFNPQVRLCCFKNGLSHFQSYGNKVFRPMHTFCLFLYSIFTFQFVELELHHQM